MSVAGLRADFSARDPTCSKPARDPAPTATSRRDAPAEAARADSRPVPVVREDSRTVGSARTARGAPGGRGERSEEHTSELQSRLHLVCRLLLEKKKKTILHGFEFVGGVFLPSLALAC